MINWMQSIALLLLIICVPSFGGVMGPVCARQTASIPCCDYTSWMFSVEGMYLRPSFEGFNRFLGDNVAITAFQGDSSTTLVLIPPPIQWDWGYKLEGAYYFGAGTDFTLNWSHFNNSRNQATSKFIQSNAGAIFGPGMIRLSPSWNAVNLEFGQYVDFSSQYSIRFHGDLGYVGLKTDLIITGAPLDFFVASQLSKQHQKFAGAGPRVGADLAYYFGKGTRLYAKGATAMYAGSKEVVVFRQTYSGTIFNEYGAKTSIVPALEAKLGMNYGLSFAEGNFYFDVGWMWVNYFDGLFGSDFGLQGLELGLKWVGNII